MIRIHSIKVREDKTSEEVLKIALKKHKIDQEDVVDWHIVKKSIDARKKEDVHYLYSIDLEIKEEEKYPQFDRVKQFEMPFLNTKNPSSKNPVIIGAGPAGLFSALILVQNGLKPIIIEQGECVEDRKKSVDTFLKTGTLNPFSNVQFGEGGAGTFSDGKLTTGINSPFCQKVLEEFVHFGAPEQILYLSKPHIGTDYLIQIIQKMREFIIKQGGTFLFQTKAIDFQVKNQQIESVIVQKIKENKKEEIPTNHVILAVGHSSHETFETLYKKGFEMEKKNFSVGVRIEHLQKWINQAQYGTKTKLQLPPVEYKLAYHAPNGRSCYTFCMCPGGVVMPSSSEKETIVTNGMSYFSREGENANAALLVNVVPDDFKDVSPLAGIYFQQDLERKAFQLGGSNYHAPIQRVEDFLRNQKSRQIGMVKPTYEPGTTLTNIQEILPTFVSETLQQGILQFDKKLHGFAHPDSILTGVETRSSSPVRILRNEKFLSNMKGVYPCGEGAGYAGGIMSAAVDGIKCAIALLEADS